MKEENSSFEPDYGLIARYLAKETDRDENQQVKEWIESSPDHAEIFASIGLIWKESQEDHFDTSNTAHVVDTDKAWKKVNRRLQPNRTVRIFLQPYMRIAASLIIAIGLVLTIYNWMSSPNYITLKATDEITNTELSDGSLIISNVGSEITYPSTFKGNTREISLKGEAYFEITSDKKKPFIIQTEKIDVLVVGTSFTVKADNPDSVVVEVETGVVEMKNKKRVLRLMAGEIGVYKENGQTLNKRLLAPVINQFWRNRRLIFKNASLADVILSLNSAYGVKIELLNPEFQKKQITVRFENQNLDVVLDVLANTMHLNVLKKENGRIILGNVEE
jgi:transmembrane sensor